MKVLTKNLKVFFECLNQQNTDICPYGERVEMNVVTLAKSGSPKCPACKGEMTIENEALVTN